MNNQYQIKGTHYSLTSEGRKYCLTWEASRYGMTWKNHRYFKTEQAAIRYAKRVGLE